MNKNIKLAVVLLAAFCVSAAGCTEKTGNTNDNTAAETARQDGQAQNIDAVREEPLDTVREERDGITYITEKYSLYSAVYPLLKNEFIQEEKICDFKQYENTFKTSKGSGEEQRLVSGINIKIPDFLAASGRENVQKVCCTLYNHAGTMSGEEVKSLSFAEINSEPLTVTAGEDIFLVLYTAYKGGSHFPDLSTENPDIEKAVIRADITYENAETETVYLGIHMKYDDSPIYMELYQLMY